MLSLSKSKALVESRGVVAKGISKNEIEEIKANLGDAGALVEIVPTAEAKVFYIYGKVKNIRNGLGVTRLSVEAWDKDLFFDYFLIFIL
jgi:hypothetical protein